MISAQGVTQLLYALQLQTAYPNQFLLAFSIVTAAKSFIAETVGEDFHEQSLIVSREGYYNSW